MRRFTIYFTLILLLALPSCRKDDTGGMPNRISFGIGGVMATKAISETTGGVIASDPNGFTVAGLKASDGLLFFVDNAVRNNGGEYKTRTEHYYPSGENAPTLNFYARYPSGDLSVNEGTVSIEDFRTAGTEDLVAAQAEDIASSANPVMLNFGHILSGISVYCRGTDEKMNYRVLSSEISVNGRGTYTYGTGKWTSVQKDKVGIEETELGSDWTCLLAERSVIPGEITLSLSWQCTDRESGIVTGVYTDVVRTSDVSVGHITRMECRLANKSATGIEFTVTVIPWEEKENMVEFK